MSLHTWQTDLSINAKKTDIRTMRDWLKEHAPPVPSTDADVIGKFLRCTIICNAEWDGVPLHITLPRPHLAAPGPWDNNWRSPGPAREVTDSDAFHEILPFLLRASMLGVAVGLLPALYSLRHQLPAFSLGHSPAHEVASERQPGVAHAQ